MNMKTISMESIKKFWDKHGIDILLSIKVTSAVLGGLLAGSAIQSIKDAKELTDIHLRFMNTYLRLREAEFRALKANLDLDAMYRPDVIREWIFSNIDHPELIDAIRESIQSIDAL